ncbi:MAG: Gfo/Idh/MocA family oxidoreductase, partial [Alphaproteobacteria bacterium]|nr:Gfo/Idh/MocA family oxidoreductase [Alphaproteobacteria bacterium]
MTLRVGLFGAAWNGFAHLPAWRALQGIEVSAVCTSREETARAAADRLGIARSFWDAEAFVADPDIDIIDFGTWPSVRLPLIITALEAGKHIYNACPHAPHWAGAKAIDNAWRRDTSATAIDAFAQHLPAHRQMKALLESGYIGQPFVGTAHFNLSLFNAPNKAFPYNWFAEPQAGVSAVRNNGSHLLYLLQHLFGEVAELVADDRQLLKAWVFPDGDMVKPETNDFAAVTLRYACGLLLQLQASWAMPVQAFTSLQDEMGKAGRGAA